MRLKDIYCVEGSLIINQMNIFVDFDRLLQLNQLTMVSMGRYT